MAVRSPVPPGKAYALAFRCARTMKHEEAVAAFDQVIRQRPKDWGAHLWRGVSLSETQAYHPAIASIERARALAPKSRVFPLFLGRVHYDHQRYEAALKAFDEGIALRPEDNLSRAYRGLVLLATGKVPNAAEAFSAILLPYDSGFQGRLLALVEAELAGTPGNRSLEECLMPSGRPAHSEPSPAAEREPDPAPAARHSSLDALLAALSHPLSPVARERALHRRAGDRFLHAGGYAPACGEYRQALESAPDSREIRARLIEALLALNEPAEALREARALAEASPDDPNNDAQLGVCLYRAGDYAAAERHLEALAAENRLADFWLPYYCGLCATGLGKRLAARHWFESAAGLVNPGIAGHRLAEYFRMRETPYKPGG